MRIAYREELEKAARQMILIHRTDTLIKLIIRTVIKTLKVTHSGVFLFDKIKKSYVFTISKGQKGLKLPTGLIKMSNQSPLIRYFNEYAEASGMRNFLTVIGLRKTLRSARARKEPDFRQFHQALLYQMNMYKVTLAIPIFFQNHLLGVFILGPKKDKAAFSDEELAFLSILSSDVAMAIRNAALFEDLAIQLEKNQNLFLQTIATLAEAIEAKDKYTIGHTERVVEYSMLIGEQLKKIRKIKNWPEFQKSLRISALLHDIGKIGVPEKVLNKKSPLKDSDWQAIKTHPATGESILAPIKDLKDVILGVKYHHERFDGNGYPYGLKGAKIPLIAAIISVADAFDAMITDRPYRKGFSQEKAITIIKENSSTQFHPTVVQAFLKVFDKSQNQ
jgi:HD-GYP domain-containing protein (c-di-GMP phosphodiesterase class II)